MLAFGSKTHELSGITDQSFDQTYSFPDIFDEKDLTFEIL